MKKIFILLLLTSFFPRVHAQITITDADMPSAGTLYIKDNGGNTGIIDLSVTGANQAWDYSQLTVTGTDTTEYTTIASTPILYQFYFNNAILYSNWKADLALPAPDLAAIPNSPITITDVINYYKITSTAFYLVGFGATINSIPSSQRYDPRDKLLKLPNTFGLVDSNDFAWLFEIPSVASYGQFKTRSNETDGWGTLQLPYASYNTLRVKSTITGIDTFYVNQFSFGLAIPSTQYEINWYALGEGEPVLTVNATAVGASLNVTGARFKHTTPTGIANPTGPLASFTIAPNPVKDKLFLHYQVDRTDEITVRIYDVSGKMVMQENKILIPGSNSQMEFDISSYAKGYYTVSLQSRQGVQSSKLVIY